MQKLSWEKTKIINVANELLATGYTSASTGEQIAAAFVLNRMEFIPNGYTVIEAWERLDDWQGHARQIQRDYMHLIKGR